MTIIVGLAIGLILAGLVMAALSGHAGSAILAKIVWVVGVALIVVGLILLISPVILWVNGHLRQMLGQ